MAVKIPIVTVFDSKGIKAAQYQLKKVQGNVQNLGRNFAIAGAAIAGFGAVIGKSLQAAAEQQKVYAQTAAVLKSTGTTANGTAEDIAKLAGSLQKQTAFADDAIQSGANLLLTFKNIQNAAGAGNDIFNQTVAATLDVARAMGTDASGEAIRLGKALNDPVKGISALTRVGIQFTDQQKAQIKALTESGDLLGAQKIILAELQSQFGGSAAAYANTFAGQLESLNNELGDMGEEIGFAVMPAIQGLITELRNLIPVIGPQIKSAIEGVDWKGLVTTLVNLVTWFTQNAKTIGIVVAAVWALNTAYNVGKIAIGLYNATIVLTNAALAATGVSSKLAAVGIYTATGALKLFKLALIGTGIGALLVALGFLIERMVNYTDQTKSAYTVTGSWGGAIEQSGRQAEWAAGKYGIATDAVLGYKSAMAIDPKDIKAGNAGGVLDSYGYNKRTGQPVPTKAPSFQDLLDDALGLGDGAGGGGAKTKTKKKTPLADFLAQLKIDARKAVLQAKLIGAGMSEGLASQLISSLPIKKIKKVLDKIVKTGGDYAKRLQAIFNQTAAGIAELNSQIVDDVGSSEQSPMSRLRDSLRPMLVDITKMFGAAKKEMGEFETAVVDAMDNISKTIYESDVRARTKVRLVAIVEFVKGQMQSIARERDAVAAKLAGAKSFMASIVESIMSASDVTKLGRSSKAIISSLRKTVAETLKFQSDINKLRNMGLGENVLRQIIQAGAVEGGQTARALLGGGQTAVNEVNDLYAQLGETATNFSETAAQAVYGAGVDTTNGLIAGLLAQENALRLAAERLGNTFAEGFGKRSGIRITPDTPINVAGTSASGAVYNITVNAPMGSGKNLGELIVNELTRFEERNGRVYARA